MAKRKPNDLKTVRSTTQKVSGMGVRFMKLLEYKATSAHDLANYICDTNGWTRFVMCLSERYPQLEGNKWDEIILRAMQKPKK